MEPLQTVHKKRWYDHIMPHRMVRRGLWILAEILILLVLVIFTDMLWKSIYRGLPYAAVLLGGALFGFAFAWPDAVRLSRDQTMRKAFLDATADGSYEEREDLRRLLHADEFWNDCFTEAFLTLVTLSLVLVRMQMTLLYDPMYETLAETQAVLFPVMLHLGILYAVTQISFGFLHLFCSVWVHRRWNAERMSTQQTGETLPEKKPFI